MDHQRLGAVSFFCGMQGVCISSIISEAALSQLDCEWACDRDKRASQWLYTNCFMRLIHADFGNAYKHVAVRIRIYL